MGKGERKMNAGLLFYRARRTAVCQNMVRRAAGWFGVTLTGACVCVRPEDLNGDIARLLHANSAIFLFSPSPERRPECAAPVFRTLRVPLDATGEPKGILRLPGPAKTGYLVESADQAIVLLPDDPAEMKRMLPPVFLRLKKKFGLPCSLPQKRRPAPGGSAETAAEP